MSCDRTPTLAVEGERIVMFCPHCGFKIVIGLQAPPTAVHVAEQYHRDGELR